MASRIEYCTRQYGVPILVSGQFKMCLSKKVAVYLREIDRVTVKGSTIPIKLFTVDVDYENLEEQPDRYATMLVKEKKQMRDDEKKKILGQINLNYKKTHEVWSKDSDFQEMRKSHNKAFS